MLYNDFKDFVDNLPSTGRLLGIDWGAKRIGVAISTTDRGFIFPKDNLDEVMDIIQADGIVGIVVGLPLLADGNDSDITRRVREFAATLDYGVPVGFIDEILTSSEATEINQKSEIRNQKSIDSVAASVILENAIEMIKRTQGV
ncbi:MAG: Holliday junction resolvase RuvX [Alphaproteobacteria bacterium]|nr:Holliday junction resolvase RuvX [Alphaproteobacteria bacterium]